MATAPRPLVRDLSETDVAEILAAGMTERALRIDTHVRFVDGTIYDGRPAFDDDECGLPLSARRPTVQYLGVRNAIKEFGDMVLGEGRYPDVTSAPDEDDEEQEGEDGLSEDESATLDHGVAKVAEQAGLKKCFRQFLARAQGAGATAILASVRAGKLRTSTFDSKNCEPEFDPEDPSRVARLVVSYRYKQKELDRRDGKWKWHVYQYRREVDAEKDVTFAPVEIYSAKEFPTPRQAKTVVKHGFGFCPVVWYEHAKEETEDGDRDGHPIHEHLLTLVDAINQALSQRHRAAIYCGDPQIVEIGVEDEDVLVPIAAGGPSSRAGSPTDASGWQLNGKRSPWRGTTNAKRKKGAGSVWRYQSETAKVAYLTLPADALKVLDDDGKDLIAMLREGLQNVYLDPDKLAGSGDVSGKTLAFILKQQIAAANSIRQDFWGGCMLPVLGMLLRIVLRVEKGLYLPGAEKLRPILQRYEREVEGATGKSLWFDPPLRPLWGPYFEAAATDEQATVAMVAQALGGGGGTAVVTKTSAVTKIKSIFKDIGDPVAYVEALKKEADEDFQRQQDQLHQTMTAMGADDGATKAGGGAVGAGGKRPGAPAAKGAAGGGARGAAPAPGAPRPKRSQLRGAAPAKPPRAPGR